MGEPSALRLMLFDYWRLTNGEHVVDVPPRSQRLLALLALRGRQNRARLAGTLWPDVDEHRARASLRAAVLGVVRRVDRLLDRNNGEVSLSDSVVIDVDEFRRRSTEMLSGRQPAMPPLPLDQPTLTGGELLPGWYDDWVFAERERIHQLRLHVLEALADSLLERGDYAHAVHVALEAVATDPLRESARRSVIRVHLAEGNVAEAIREFDRFRTLLHDELGVEPTEHISALVPSMIQLSRV
jgi:DNA-binding SARP family transcriptional activator